MVKICIIGAGSVVWSSILIKDLCLTKSLWGSTISLMDVDRERLEVIFGLAKRYAAEVKADLRLEKTIDRKKALEDSDFVFNTALAGGHSNFELQRKVAEKHGYYRGIDSVDHNMVSDYPTIGGYNQLKLFMDIARDMEDICPEAWLILTANPVFEGSNLLTRQTKLKVIGLCHGHFEVNNVAETIGLGLKDLKTESIGFNHCIWMTSFLHKGEDAYPILEEWIKTKAELFWRNWNPKYFDVQMSPAAVDLYKRFELFPIGDTPRSGGWRYHMDLETKKRWYGPLGGFDSEIGWAHYQEDLRKQMSKMRKAYKNQSIRIKRVLPPFKSGEQHIPLVDAIVSNKKRTFQVNIPNKGVIHGIPDDVVVEVPAILSGNGVQRTHVEGLPKHLMLHIMIPRLLKMEWAVEAFLEGGKDLLLEWLLNDPRTESLEQAESVIKDILALPFNKEMAAHYK
ncbi:MAG: alpha-glucosidase/alpha-galactosidase [Candidatus Heimdallarchaeota archaeon]